MNEAVQTYDVATALRDLAHPDPSSGDGAGDAFRILARFGAGGLVVGGFTGQTPWEIHPDTDELLYAVEGEAEITILAEDGTHRGTLRRGHICVVPKGLWHRQFARDGIKFLAISGPATHSWADDPRKSNAEQADGK
jgi:mannose-6-phosphate isomerase-like protein (cupin superfamily)